MTANRRNAGCFHSTWAATDILLMVPRLFVPSLMVPPSGYERAPSQDGRPELAPEGSPTPVAAPAGVNPA
jgi:hypothetical protein